MAEQATSAQEPGTLIVVVMKARNLHNTRAVSKQNPFCVVRVGEEASRTPTITRGGQTPTWDHEARFKIVDDREPKVLKLTVFDQGKSTATLIGDAEIDLGRALAASSREGFDMWHSLTFNSRYVGEVYLEMTHYARRRRSRHMHANSSVTSLASSASSSVSRELPSPSHYHSQCLPDPPQVPSHSSLSSHSRSSSQSSRPLPAIPMSASRSRGFYNTNPQSVPDLSSTLGQSLRRSGDSRLSMQTSQSMHNLTLDPKVQQRKLPSVHGSTLEEQSDISKQINDRYNASLFDRIFGQI